MSKSTDEAISFGIGTVFGILAGVVAGIIYSPKPGEDIRKDIKKAACKFTTKIPTDVECATKASNEAITKVKFMVEEQMNKINEAVKAGRMAAAKRKEELESDYTY